MSYISSKHAHHLLSLLNNNNETQAHIYLETILRFPVNVQDEIIERISHLTYCTSDEVAKIMSEYNTDWY